ncbi:unnamed protein product, partial [Polarella glacialis]
LNSDDDSDDDSDGSSSLDLTGLLSPPGSAAAVTAGVVRESLLNEESLQSSQSVDQS